MEVQPIYQVSFSRVRIQQIQKFQGLVMLREQKKHAVFTVEVNALQNKTLATEVSYLNGEIVPYGTRGSIRFDV